MEIYVVFLIKDARKKSADFVYSIIKRIILIDFYLKLFKKNSYTIKKYIIHFDKISDIGF
jgi:hypothetical protein